MVVNDSQKTQKAGMDASPPEKEPLLPGPLKKYLIAEAFSVYIHFQYSKFFPLNRILKLLGSAF